MANLYEGNINEFVDWIEGINELTGENVTDNKSVSGGAIRKLLQEKLKQPIYTYRDPQDNMYKIFSSETAWRAWFDDDSGDLDNLVLFSFKAPNPYSIQVNGLSEGNMYIFEGSQGDAQLNYTWGIIGDGGQISDDITITYTLENNGNSKTFQSVCRANERTVNINLYDFLEIGDNIVTIKLKSSTYGAETQVQITMVLLSMELISDFKFYIEQSGASLSIPIKLVRNITNINNQNDNTKILFYIDGIEQTSVLVSGQTTATNSYVYDRNQTLNLPDDFCTGKHNLQIRVEMKISGVAYYSELLYQEFMYINSSQTISNTYAKTILASYKFPRETVPIQNEFVLSVEQYENFLLDWAYYTIDSAIGHQVEIKWVVDYGEGVQEDISIIQGQKHEKSQALQYTFSNPSNGAYYLIPYYKNGQSWIQLDDIKNITIYPESLKYPLKVTASSLALAETQNFALKLNAKGKSNNQTESVLKNWTYKEYSTEFSENIPWTNLCGWYDDSLRLCGENNYATINYDPFFATSYNVTNEGMCFEIEFLTENINSNTDVLARIGNNYNYIEIGPDYATLFMAQSEIVKTNFKSNERMKLEFIVYPQNYSLDTTIQGVAMIVNNGILERGGRAKYDNVGINTTDGCIKLGGSESGIRIFNMRGYRKYISYIDAYNNYVYDSSNRLELLHKNEVFENGGISYNLCLTKMNTILIEGEITQALVGNVKQSTACTCDITLTCPDNPLYNMKIKNGKIRKHGQSTLNYPVPNFKIWSNSNTKAEPKLTQNDKGNWKYKTQFPQGWEPKLECEGQAAFEFTKNRYKMKEDSIPSNKWVLQANYADSSGVHNGGLQRLINNTWYDALIDGEHKLRTPPQLFATNNTISFTDNELGEVVEGESPFVQAIKQGLSCNKEHAELTGNKIDEIISNYKEYKVRVAPDSQPCVVFVRDTTQGKDNSIKFLGQYVMMEDKKSDFCFGERSMYKSSKNNDPFCITETNSDNDKDKNKIWDNSNVLRIEVLAVNNGRVSYSNLDNIKLNSKDSETNPTKYLWEDDFEVIYPDPDDIEDGVKEDIANGKKNESYLKYGENSQYLKKVKPFWDWIEWLVGTRPKNLTPTNSANGNVGEHGYDKFRSEAAQHLDLYKLAAYYIMVLRYGLVDSLERNAQLKTYDGQHWWYEPWDMDIALGNKNTGGITFTPPMTRNTTFNETKSESGESLGKTQHVYAISGRSENEIGELNCSNWLWDALEHWPYWMEVIVPKVNDALYAVGLNYDRSNYMFDEQYAATWPESIYNNSGYFKYIQSRGSSDTWLDWLQGARLTHRHWWLNSSMNYYDAKWGCGEFKKNTVYIACNKSEGVKAEIKIVPKDNTFFQISKTEVPVTGSNKACSKQDPYVMDITNIAFTTKQQLHILGALFIEELYLNDLATNLDIVTLDGCYSEGAGPTIKVLDVGVNLTPTDNGYSGINNAIQGFKLNTSDKSLKYDVLEICQKLNVRGQTYYSDNSDSLLMSNDRSSIKVLNAMGTDMTTFTNAPSGNQFELLELPNTIKTLTLYNASWDTIEFWDAKGSAIDVQIVDEENSTLTETKYKTVKVKQNNYSLAYSTDESKNKKQLNFIDTIRLSGNTAKSLNSKKFIFDWINSLNGNYDGKHLILEDVYWSEESGLNYSELIKLSNFSECKNWTGYIKINAPATDENGNWIESHENYLTQQKLAELTDKFGDQIFISGSNGLKIDYALQECLITSSCSDFRDGAYYICENSEVVDFFATTFNFDNSSDDTEYSWELRTSVSADNINSVSLTKDEYISKRCKIKVHQGKKQDDYELDLVCKSGTTDVGSVKLHIITSQYPEQYELNVIGSPTNTVINPSSANLGTNNLFVTITPNAIYSDSDKPKALPSNITYKIEGGNIGAESKKVEKSFNLNATNKDENLNFGGGIQLVIIGSGAAIRFTSTSTIDQEYKLSISYQYEYIDNNDKFTYTSEELTYFITVMQNDQVVVPSSPMFTQFKQLYEESTGTSFYNNQTLYRSHFRDINIPVVITGYSDITAASGESILKYLVNVPEITLQDCDNLSNKTSTNKDVLDFTQLKNLKKLTITNCPKLGNAILDVSKCKELSYIDIFDTNLDFIFEPDSIQNFEKILIGCPRIFKISNLNTTYPFRKSNFDENYTFISKNISMYTYQDLINGCSFIIRNRNNIEEVIIKNIYYKNKPSSADLYYNLFVKDDCNVYGIRISNKSCQRIGLDSMHKNLPVQNDIKGCILNDEGVVQYYLYSNDEFQGDIDEFPETLYNNGVQIKNIKGRMSNNSYEEVPLNEFLGDINNWKYKAKSFDESNVMATDAQGNPIQSHLDGTDGQVMVEIPEHYIKFSKIDRSNYVVQISKYWFYGATKKPKTYISAYEAKYDNVNDKLASVCTSVDKYKGGCFTQYNNNTTVGRAYYKNPRPNDKQNQELVSLNDKPIIGMNLYDSITKSNRDNKEQSNWNIMSYNLIINLSWLMAIEFNKVCPAAQYSDRYIHKLDVDGFHQGFVGHSVGFGDNGYSKDTNTRLSYLLSPCGSTNSFGNYTGNLCYFYNPYYTIEGQLYYASSHDVFGNVRYRGIENLLTHYQHQQTDMFAYTIAGTNNIIIYYCNDRTKLITVNNFKQGVDVDPDYIFNNYKNLGISYGNANGSSKRDIVFTDGCYFITDNRDEYDKIDTTYYFGNEHHGRIAYTSTDGLFEESKLMYIAPGTTFANWSDPGIFSETSYNSNNNYKYQFTNRLVYYAE